jgi:hypothetical protein
MGGQISSEYAQECEKLLWLEGFEKLSHLFSPEIKTAKSAMSRKKRGEVFYFWQIN